MKKEYLNPKINKKIEKIIEVMTLKPKQISNDEWLDKREWSRIGKEHMCEKYQTRIKAV